MAQPTNDEVIEIARLTMTAPHLANVRPTATEDGVAEAVRRVERLAA
jgi:glycerol dehydrogenase